MSYQSVDCLKNWAGASNAAALGSVDDGSSVCCPANPTVSCPPRPSLHPPVNLRTLSREVQTTPALPTPTTTASRTSLPTRLFSPPCCLRSTLMNNHIQPFLSNTLSGQTPRPPAVLHLYYRPRASDARCSLCIRSLYCSSPLRDMY